MTRFIRARELQLLQIAVHVGSLLPLAVLIWDLFHNNVTVDPIRGTLLRTGKIALTLLILSLACTPLNTVFGIRQAIKWRRPLGLYAFFYASIHLLVFVGIDYGFDLGLLEDAILEKRYALAGLAAFLILVPLAITSTRGWMKRMGTSWRTLHQGVYIASLLAAVHFIWLVKADIQEPLLYAGAIVLLLFFRLPPVRRALRRIRPARRAPAPRGPLVPSR